MAQSLRIELLSNTEKVAKQIAELNKQLEKLQKLDQDGKGTVQALSAATSSSSGSSVGSSRSAGRRPPIAAIQGPFQRMNRINSQLGQHPSFAPAYAQQQDALLAQSRAQAQVNRALGVQKPFDQRLMNFIRSTRFGAGGFSPLVGQTMDLLGIGGKAAGGAGAGGAGAAGAGLARLAGPIGLAILAFQGVSKAAQMFGKQLEEARQRMMEYASIQNTAGGRPSSSIQAARIAMAIGEDPGSVGAQARSIIDGIAGGGPAATYANRYGVRSVPGMGDPSNKMDRFMRLIQGIANDPSEENARRAAQSLGMEQYLNLRQLSQSQRNRLFSGKNGSASEGSSAAVQMNFELSEIQTGFKRLMDSITVPFMKLTTRVLEPISVLVDRISSSKLPTNVGSVLQVLDKLSVMFDKITQGSFNRANQITKVFEFLDSIISRILKGLGIQDEDKQKSSIDRNTDAVNENTRALNGGRETFGGGDRARSAVPSAWQGKDFQDKYMRAQARAMGAFSW